MVGIHKMNNQIKKIAIVLFSAYLVSFYLMIQCFDACADTGSPVSSSGSGSVFHNAIRVGVDHKNPPFEFIDEQGDTTGFNIDLLEALAQVMGLRLEIVTGPWETIRTSLENGQLDMVSGMYYSKERDAKVDFSVPFIIVYESMFVRKESCLNTIEELINREVIVQSADIMHDYIVSNNVTDHIIQVENTLDGIYLLASGQHDSALLPKLQGQYLLNKYNITNVKAAGPAILAQKYCFAVSEGNHELAAILDQGLSILKSSGRYKDIRENWFGVIEGNRYLALYRMVLGALVGLVLLLSISWIWTWSLRRHVQRKTRQLADELVAHQRTLGMLKDKEAHLRALVESSPDAILVVDQQLCMTDCNPAFMKQLGFDQNDIKGQHLSLIFPDEEDMVLLEKSTFAGIARTGVWQDERLYKMKSGALVPMETTVSEKKLPGGNLGGYVAIMRNISKRKQVEKEKHRLEDQLRLVHKMEAIGTLAAGIAHDFNNILSSIIGYGELARRSLPPENPARQDLEEVLESADRAKDLVRHILTYSRRSEQERRPEYFSSLVEDSLRLLRASLPANIEIIKDFAVDEDLILADATQMNQVIINLVTNAAHAVDKGQGSIEIRLRDIELEEQETTMVPAAVPGRHIELTVTDNGHGIDKSILDRIFDPFFTTKQRGEGTGMGLSVVHGIIKDHGGFIRVKSRLGEGTSFHIIFPLYDGAYNEIVAPGPIIGGNERILLIDNEEKVTNAWQRILMSLGYHVVASTSPREGLRRFSDSPTSFDLVITDLDMPEMAGSELIQKLKTLFADIKIIIHTGFSKALTKVELEQLGVIHCLHKPVSTNVMAKTLRSVLDKKNSKSSVNR